MSSIMKFGIFDIPYSLDYETGAESPEEIIDWGLQAVSVGRMSLGLRRRFLPSITRLVGSRVRGRS